MTIENLFCYGFQRLVSHEIQHQEMGKQLLYFGCGIFWSTDADCHKKFLLNVQ